MEETLASDPTIKTTHEGGSVQSRPRFTTLRKRWVLNYTLLTAADKTLLEAFQIEVLVGSYIFTWVHPKEDETSSGGIYSVRLEDPIKFTSESPSVDPDAWRAVLALVEA
jgi:hypothetical protein